MSNVDELYYQFLERACLLNKYTQNHLSMSTNKHNKNRRSPRVYIGKSPSERLWVSMGP